MALNRIDSLDFITDIVSTSTSCWTDTNNIPVDSPTFSSQSVTYTVSGSINTITNYYIGSTTNTQFSVALADKNGVIARKALYGALRNIVLGDKNAEFTWGGSSRSIFSIISIARSKYKTALLPGSLRIGNYTDNSNESPPQLLNCGRAYTLTEGFTLPGGGFSYGQGEGSYGLVFPDIGIIITNLITATNINAAFQLQYEDFTPINSVFIRARNSEYNYSTNPSFISGSSGIIIHPEWYNSPQTYITTIGLYNDNNELLATAKLPRPYNKNFHNEALFQVNLNF
jgi:hypothetical protein